MILRKATMEDLDAVYELLNELYNYRVKYEIFKELYAEKLKDINNYYTVMENKEEVIAILTLEIKKKLTRAKKEAYVESIIVKEKHRNRGIGRKMLIDAIEYAKKIDCEVIDLTCVLSNEKGQQFYENIGFKKHSYKYRIYMNEY